MVGQLPGAALGHWRRAPGALAAAHRSGGARSFPKNYFWLPVAVGEIISVLVDCAPGL